MLRPRLQQVAVALVAVALAASPATAQDLFAKRGNSELRIPPPVPVTVALVEELPVEYRSYDALVKRQRAGGDFILVPRGRATVGALDTAMRVLLDSRLILGLRPQAVRGGNFETLILAVEENRPSSDAWLVHYAGKIQAVLDSLMAPSAEVRMIPGVGRVPATQVVPPELSQWLLPKIPPGAAGPRQPGGE